MTGDAPRLTLAPNTRRPRVVLIADYPADHESFTGGVQTATAALLDGLRAYQAEFEFHVISLVKSFSGNRRELRDGVWFHFLGINYPRLPTRYPLRIAKVFLELRRIKPDLVHCHANQAGALAATLGGYRRLMTVHGIGRVELQLRGQVPAWRRRVAAILERYVFQNVGPIICISEYARRMVGDGPRTFSIPNAVSCRFFELPMADHAGPPSLLFAGLLGPLKRPADLLGAHAALRPEFPCLRTLIVGPAENEAYAAAMREKVSNTPLPGVEFLGRLGRGEVAALLGEATVLVVTSAQENAPMVIAEAMAAGLPVVATRVGGVPEMVVSGETGFLYEVGDVTGLTECLRRLLSDTELCRRLGRQARERACAMYTPSRVAEQITAVYRTLLEYPSP